MIFETVDELAGFYFAAADHLGALRALPLPVGAAERCRRDEGLPTWVLNESGKWRKRCSVCELPWANVAVPTKTYKASGKADAYTSAHRVEDAFVEQLAVVEPLRRVFEPVPHAMSPWRWGFCLDSWRIYLHPLVPSVAATAFIGARIARDERSSRAWSPMSCGRAIAAAREIVERRGIEFLPAQNRYAGASAG